MLSLSKNNMKVSDKGILGKIKEIRIKKGFSQDYLASKLGMKQPGYGMIENGVSKITVLMLLEIAIILEIHIIDLIAYPAKYVKIEDLSKNPLTEQLEFKNEQISFYKEKIENLEQKLQICENEKKHSTLTK